jgi:hypothetical protein
MNTEVIGTLPKFFKYSSALDLVRVGRANDGGYLVSKSDIEKSSHLIGLGINDDWSFEEHFSKLKKVTIQAYDGSISAKIFLKQCLKSLMFLKPRGAIRSFFVFVEFNKFFSNLNTHIPKFVSNISSDSFVSIEDVFSAVPNDEIFMKIDIEGAEYRILDSIVTNASKLTGFVIEFHDCDLHLDRINNFISNLPLKLVHIHANNFGRIGANGIPHTLELTFSKYAKHDVTCTLPHPLDMPNNPLAKEIKLSVV